MKLRVKSLRTGKFGYATEIHRDHGDNFWQVTDDNCDSIVFFPDSEFRRIFSVKGEVSTVPIPGWVKTPATVPPGKKKGASSDQMMLFNLSQV